jgi:hypothetical protein
MHSVFMLTGFWFTIAVQWPYPVIDAEVLCRYHLTVATSRSFLREKQADTIKN